MDFNNLFKNYGAVGIFILGGLFIIGIKENLEDGRLFYLSIGYLAIAIPVAIFLYFVNHKKSSVYNKRNKSNIFFYKPNRDEDYDVDFYDHFEKNILNATKQIIMTGDGFGCKTKKNKEKAEKYIQKYRDILNKGIGVLRVQIESKSHPEWAKLLGRLVDDFPNKFELYIIKESSIRCIECAMGVVDPQISGKNSTYLMYTENKTFLSQTQSLATYAFIIENDKDFAKEIMGRILDLKKPKFSWKVTDSKEVQKILCSENSNILKDN